MRPSAILPLLCAIAALVLSLLCVFAGDTTSFLQNANLLTLNTSRIGHTPAFNTTSSSGGFFSNLLNSIEGSINTDLGIFASDIAKDFQIKDFYNVHLMNYCEGYYQPNTTAPHPTENVTYCSNRTSAFHFDPTAVIQSELPSGINLTDIHWPSEIQDATNAVKVASTIMFVFYVIGIVFAGLAVAGALFGVFANGRISAILNFVLDILAFLALGIASAISTAVIVKAVDAVNKYGSDIGIAAYKGKTFLGMTWAATGVMLLAAMVWVFECCRGRSRNRASTDKDAYRGY